MSARSVLFTVMLAAGVGPAAATLTTPVAWETVYHGGIRFDVDMGVARATTTTSQVIDSQEELDAFYENLLYGPIPSVDFTDTVVLAAVTPSDWTDGYFAVRRIDAMHTGGLRDLTVSVAICTDLMFCIPEPAAAHLVAVERIPGLVVFSAYQPYGPGIPLGADRIE